MYLPGVEEWEECTNPLIAKNIASPTSLSQLTSSPSLLPVFVVSFSNRLLLLSCRCVL